MVMAVVIEEIHFEINLKPFRLFLFTVDKLPRLKQ
jgi:hypothetical protein